MALTVGLLLVWLCVVAGFMPYGRLQTLRSVQRWAGSLIPSSSSDAVVDPSEAVFGPEGQDLVWESLRRDAKKGY